MNDRLADLGVIPVQNGHDIEMGKKEEEKDDFMSDYFANIDSIKVILNIILLNFECCLIG